jgi:hypothetical protein
MLPGVWESTREWTSTLSNELPLWKLESKWIPEFSKSNFRGENSLDWSFRYTIRNILECRCLKWARMTNLGNQNTSYGQKKGQKSNCRFDSWPLKVRNLPNLLACKWHATYRWEALDRLQLLFKSQFNQRFAHKVMGFQNRGKSQFW